MAYVQNRIEDNLSAKQHKFNFVVNLDTRWGNHVYKLSIYDRVKSLYVTVLHKMLLCTCKCLKHIFICIKHRLVVAT